MFIHNIQGQESRRMPAILIMFSVFILMLIAVGFIQGFVGILNIEKRTALLTGSAIQNLFIFIIPAIIGALIMNNRPFLFLGMEIRPSLRQLTGVVIVMAIGIPAMNQLVYWNENIHLPESMQWLEQIMVKMESQAQATTNTILSASSIGALLTEILLIGILTGLAEETFFRGALQQMVAGKNVKPIPAIWIVAIVFSIMHFQFFGFFPRMVLGAFFGYLLYWSKSLWTGVFAHALNNTIVVTSAWLINRGLIDSNSDSIGVVTYGFPWPAIASTVLVILFFCFCKNYFFVSPSQNN